MASVWLNGDLLDESEARLATTDRGFTLGDGVFETIRANEFLPLWLSDHLQRLRAGADQIGLPVPFQDDAIADAIGRLLATTKQKVSAVRLTVSRGSMTARGLWPVDATSRPTCLLTAAAAGAHPLQDVVIARTTRRNEFSPLSRIKSLNYGDNIIARREAISRGATDALMLNTKGHVACATVGNVFIRTAGRWMTPTIPDGILSGLARWRLIKEIGAIEATLTIDDVGRADAAFISNSLGCSMIRSIDGRLLSGTIDEGPLHSIYSV